MNKPTPRAKDGTKLTRVVNLFDENYDVYIGRKGFGMTGEFGNPYRLNKDGTRDEILMKFRKYFIKRMHNDPEFNKRVLGLRGSTLGCFCPSPSQCHGGIMASYLDASRGETTEKDS